ncbi:MAG: type II secretion system major pseudopilin GspG [Deltaproteobacteria bacterium]|nr:MAG: type II secretion system major pseudopilin GspG [Deltaproteobacteria bacterium]
MRANVFSHKGFTLIEIMVVVVIIGILTSLVAVNVVGRIDEAKRKAARAQISTFEAALSLYKLDNGVYPETSQGLEALVDPPSVGMMPCCWKKGGYLKKDKVPLDPWGSEYVYRGSDIATMEREYEIVSYGADRTPGGEDKNADIESWNLDEQ